ncbi:hypothetical protein [Oceanimonas smirnovii]|uniref:Sulfotransferase family protein n=1 Tax=Oceanimonas smirnovii TaxID=264574 RepID=A0ABW7P4G9_9GAMM
MNKTGTTALQKHLANIKGSVSDSGVLYPDTGLIGEAHYSLSTSLSFCNPTVPSEWKKDKKELNSSLTKEINKNTRKVIFSSEDFLLNKPFTELKSFFKGYPIKAVVYLRRHDHWWLSAYTQAVKMKHLPPWNQGPQGFINFNRKKNKTYGDYRHLVDRWANAIGKENVIVRPYEAAQNQPDLAADFFKAIGEPELAEKLPRMAVRENSSLPMASVQLMDIFQRIDADPELHQKLLAHARLFGKDDTRHVRDMVNPQFLRNLVDSYQEDYAYIAREYLGREDGQLFYEPLPEPVENWKWHRWPTQAEVAQEVLKVVNQK